MTKLISYLITLFLFNLFLPNTCEASVQSGLVNDIKRAKNALDKTQNRISLERTKLANKLRAQEQFVSKLRESAAVSQRLQDEKTLSLQQLQKRLKNWTEQEQYQQNSLSRFNQSFALQPMKSNATTKQKIDWLNQHVNNMTNKMYPKWVKEKIISNNGEIRNANVLSIGPVHWYSDTSNNSVGFASMVKEQTAIKTNSENALAPLNRLFKTELLISPSDSKGLVSLKENNIGRVLFDPTLTRAFAISNQKTSMIEHVEKGGVWIVPILLFGLFAVCIGLFKAIQFWRLPALVLSFGEKLSLLDKIEDKQQYQQAQQALFSRTKGMQANLVQIAIETKIGQKRDDRIFSSLLENKHTLEYWLGAIAITAAVSPLLGLLGTVSGMIETFKLMTLFGAGDPAAVSGGISQALVTTELGLVVAIPALVIHALLSRLSKTYYSQLEACGVNLSQLETKG